MGVAGPPTALPADDIRQQETFSERLHDVPGQDANFHHWPASMFRVE